MELFVFDVDGTLIADDGNLMPLEKELITKIITRGDAIAIASGRPHSGVLKYLNQFPPSPHKFAIAANGAEAYDGDGKLVFKEGLTYRDYLYIAEKYGKKGREVFTFIGNVLGSFDSGPWIAEELTASNMEAKRDYAIDPQQPDEYISKVLIAGDAQESKIVERELDQEDFNKYAILRSSAYFIEFVNKNTDKSVPLASIAKNLGIAENQVHTFGDALNDLKMIEKFDGTAMGNAMDEVKKVAKRITKPVSEDGVGVALRDVFKV